MKRCAARPQQKKATHPPREQRSPNTFNAAVDVAGLADFVAFMAHKPHFRRMETAAEPQFGGRPEENLGACMEISPMNHVDSIVAPLFFAGTTGDKTVPLTLHGGRLVDAMRAQQDNHGLRLRTRRRRFSIAPGTRSCVRAGVELDGVSEYLAEIGPPARWSMEAPGKVVDAEHTVTISRTQIP